MCKVHGSKLTKATNPSDALLEVGFRFKGDPQYKRLFFAVRKILA
jgi:hypothetical protein